MDTIALKDAEASALFRNLLSSGCGARPPFGRFLKRPKPILDLQSLLAVVPAESESAGQYQDVPVDRILGTEGRSNDYTECFYPCHEWMEKRWTTIHKLLHAQGISEPLELIEYGGAYFVRDGNHRVSVAKHSGIEFLPARVTHYHIPVKLPAFLDVRNVDLFVKKYEFHKRTGFFDYADDADFNVRSPKTWKKLEKEVFVNCKAWFTRHFGHAPEKTQDFIHGWIMFYKICIEHIRGRGLVTLFPELLETDIFVELVEYWNSYENPDAFWVGQVYEKFERSVRRKHLVRWLFQSIKLQLRWLSATAEDQKRFFLTTTRIGQFVPEFHPPRAGKRFFKLCYDQVFRETAKHWMDRERSQPGITDIATHWHKEFYEPVVERYRQRLYAVPFEEYYTRFSGLYFSQVLSRARGVEDCLDEFETRLA